MSFSVLIPARLASTRLPRKPLADIGGLPMVVRVARRASASAARQVVVAADDEAIVQACRAHGVRAVPTSREHPTGSDRLAEACALLGLADDELVLNVQGDEPLIDPRLIDDCAAALQSHPDCVMSTVAHPIDDAAEAANPNVVKVVTDRHGVALYFSRSLIPFWRDRPVDATQAIAEPRPLRHVGLYAYRAGFLRRFPTLEPSPIEKLEALEQLRVLWHGERIAVHVSPTGPGPGVDTPEDLARVRAIILERAGRA